MTEPIKYLFVGGPKDGERTSVPDNLPRVYVWNDQGEEVAYNRVRLALSPDKIYTIFAFENVNIIKELIRGYVPRLQFYMNGVEIPSYLNPKE